MLVAIGIGIVVLVAGIAIAGSAARVARWALRVLPEETTEQLEDRITSLVFLVRLVGYFAVAVGAVLVATAVA